MARLQQGQGTPVLPHGAGLALGELLPPQHPLVQGGSPLTKPKLGHGRSSRAVRAGSSSVKLQSLA